MILVGSGWCRDGMSWASSGQVHWVLMEASSERHWEASELVHASDGALMLLMSVLAEKVEAPAVLCQGEEDHRLSAGSGGLT